MNTLLDQSNNTKVAIVVVGYNRLLSISRLLFSIQNAYYETEDIPLVISIDCSGDSALYKYVNDFEWKHGTKYVFIQPEKLGLKKHIFWCGDLTRYFRGIILLEDDLYVSRYFYDYSLKTIEFYEKDNRIGGISLYQNEMGNNGLPRLYINDGSDTYLKQSVASWGECWTRSQWKAFKDWLQSFNEEDFASVDMPAEVKKWERAWSKYYIAYLIKNNRYFVFPYLSLTTCFGDAGEHNSSASLIGQVPILVGKKDYHFYSYDKMVRYDIYGVNEMIYSWLNIPKHDIIIDWYGKYNHDEKKYVLSVVKMPYKVIRSYGLVLRPLEMNVLENINGNGIYLYERTGKKVYQPKKKYLPASLAEYYLRSFNIRLTMKYILNRISQILLKKQILS